MATLLLIHDLHPVPLERAGAGGARLGAPVHGVPRRQRRAAVARARRRPDPPAGQLLGLLGLVGDARAGDQAGARGGGARPRGPRGRGLAPADGRRTRAADRCTRLRRRRPGWSCRWSSSAPPAPPSWFEVDVGRRARGRDARRGQRGRARPARDRERRRHAARLPRRVRRLRRGRCTTASCSAGALACPGCGRSFFLPRAGRSMDDERIQLEPVPLLREQGRVKVALAR